LLAQSLDEPLAARDPQFTDEKDVEITRETHIVPVRGIVAIGNPLRQDPSFGEELTPSLGCHRQDIKEPLACQRTQAKVIGVDVGGVWTAEKNALYFSEVEARPGESCSFGWRKRFSVPHNYQGPLGSGAGGKLPTDERVPVGVAKKQDYFSGRQIEGTIRHLHHLVSCGRER
jgi:hypothetical protein